MKNLILILSTIILLSSCPTITKIYSMSAGKIDIPRQKNYLVVYEANFGTRLKATVNYTNADVKLTKLKKYCRRLEADRSAKIWRTCNYANFGKRGETEVHYKISVDGKPLSEKDLTGKRIRYAYSFDLP